MNFFAATFGFSETDYESTRAKLLDLAQFESVPSSSYTRERCDFTIKGEIVSAGMFSMPSVAELELEVEKTILAIASTSTGNASTGAVRVRNIVGESRSLHQMLPGSVIQAASQFNLLEFISPNSTPEMGISDYIYDRTQGPACAVACAAGTAYRNYLVPVPFHRDQTNQEVDTETRGQRQKTQLDGMADLEFFLQKEYPTRFKSPPWQVTGGYLNSTSSRIRQLNDLLAQDDSLQENLESLLRIGVQEDTTVTDVPSWDVHCTQVYSSAIAVGYSRMPTHLWEPLARLVLNATYKATLLLGILKTLEAQAKTDAPKPIPILLTKVGGGVFRNNEEWIMDAISKAIIHATSRYNVDLDIRIVHFQSIDERYRKLETHSLKDSTW